MFPEVPCCWLLKGPTVGHATEQTDPTAGRSQAVNAGASVAAKMPWDTSASQR